ncbi:MAG: flagellar hook-associated protein FlgK [Pseudomonadota bacterium]
MPALPSLTNIGLSALRAAQSSLAGTAHNIANVNTEGYSRQRVELQNARPQPLGGFNVGNGVEVRGISRLVDGALNSQLLVQTSNASHAENFLSLANRIDNVLADPNAGLSPALDDFFGAVQGVAGDPSSATQRQVLLTEAGTLSQRFGLLDERLREIDGLINADVRNSVTEINFLTGSIAELNGQIGRSAAAAGQPNDLLDQRDTVVRQLGELVSVSTVELGDGTLNVLAGAQSLVLGRETTELSVVRGTFDPNRLEVTNSSGVNITNTLRGGSLGAAFQFRDEVLDPAANGLGRVAAGLAESFNAQHRLGMDVNGSLGGDFFTSATSSVFANPTNAGGAVTAQIVDVANLTTSNYSLSADGGNAYTLTRDSDGQTFAINTGGASPFTTTEIDGFTLTITAGAATGDTFEVRPVATHAAGFGLALTSASQIAAAGPVRGEVAFGNAGTGDITGITVASVANLPLNGAPVSGTLTLTFDDTANQLTLSPDPLGEGPLAYDPSTDAGGKSFTLLGGDVSFTISGTPSNGDTFTLSHNGGGVGDNRNATALAALQNEQILDTNSASVQEAYGQLVTTVGAQTRDAQVSDSAFSALLEQARSDREQISGVNLDEEAADLLRFQQAYQASARLLTVVDDLFQTLLSAVRS